MPRLRTCFFFFFFQAEDGIRDVAVTGVQTCALPIVARASAELSGLPTDVMALAQAVDRGRRSGVGTWTFAYGGFVLEGDRKSTRLNSSHGYISYAVFCLKKKKTTKNDTHLIRIRDT